MKLFFSAVIALAAVCKFSWGGEGIPLPPAPDPAFTLFKMLTELGLPGVVIACLLWNHKEERKKREEDGKRWYALDRELVGLVEKCTQHIAESTRILVELRREIRGIRHVDARVVQEDERKSDTDHWPVPAKQK